MTFNLRFEWINWNLSCNTDADLVTQARSEKSKANSAEAAESGLVLQPPLPLRRRSLYTRRATVCVRSLSGACAAAHNAAKRLDAGVEASKEVAA
jgi:hypothetical protein